MDYLGTLEWLVLGWGWLAAVLLAPVIIYWYYHHNWLDQPSTKHVKIIHQKPVPRGGGWVVFVPILLGSLLFLQLDHYLVSILAASGLLIMVGWLDDRFDIHPLIRLAVNGLAALIVVGAGIGIAYVSNPFGEGVIRLDHVRWSFELLGEMRQIWVIADIFALLFIIWNMNIVNWSKGVDGQMPGFVAISLVIIGLLSQRFADDPTQFNTTHLSLLAAGAFAGLLVWNWYPQKMMPGYGAGSLAGFLVSVLAILGGAKVATMLMVLAIPTADAVFTILRRLRAGKKPWWGDRGHLHHKLMDVLGWGRRRIAVFYWLTSLSLGIASLYLNTIGKLLTMLVCASLVFGFLIWAKWQQTKYHHS